MEAAAPAGTPLIVRVDAELKAWLGLQREAMPADAQALVDALAGLLRAGGKRLRPSFCYWGHLAAGGGDGPEIGRASAALELVHTFAIVHDDVMDGSAMRRGAPALHRRLAEPGNDERLGESSAILAGDLAMVLADGLFRSSGFGPDELTRASRRFDAMRVQAICGEFLDVRAAHTGGTGEADARRIAWLKSGGYTVADPLAIGALLAGGDADVLATLEAFGRPIGVAFQLRDDILGVFGDPARTGKDRDGDLREAKRTVLLAKALSMSGPDDRRLIEDTIGPACADPARAQLVREAIARSGAIAQTERDIASLAAEAERALEGSPVPAGVCAELRSLARHAVTREA